MHYGVPLTQNKLYYNIVELAVASLLIYTRRPVVRNFTLPNHSMQHMVVCGLSLYQGSTESHTTLEQKFISQIGTLDPHAFHSTNLFCCFSRYQAPTNSVAPSFCM